MHLEVVSHQSIRCFTVRLTSLASALGLVAALTMAGCGGSSGSSDAQAGGASGNGNESPAAGAAGAAAVELPTEFDWTSTGPLVSPIPDDTHPILSVKDPTVVYFEDQWHLFATTANTSGNWSMIYLSFSDWPEAAAAQPYYLDNNPALRGYHCAPQVFYFSPQDRWYLIFQSQQPQYSTTDDITDPESWSTPRNFFAGEPEIVTENKGDGTWLDYWMICDDSLCHLFFTDDNGHLYRAETSIDDFPEGFGDPVIAIDGTRSTLFEGSATYRVRGTGEYLTLVEAIGSGGERYYRSFVADTLDGEWSPLAATEDNPFAARSNVTFEDGDAWTLDISHGELLRDGYDESLTIDPANLRFLYQGMDPSQASVEYHERPYRLALLTYTDEPTENPDDPQDGPSVCEGTTITGMEQIGDFEDGTVSDWWASYDETATAENTSLAVEEPGANGTGYTIHFSGSGYQDWGANFGRTFGCTDVSAFDGITFYARGTSGADNALNVIAQVAAALPVASGGDCQENCWSHPRTSITLTEDWQRYVVPFADLQHPGWGVAADYEGTIMGLVFESAGPDFDVWLDEVTLYSGTPPDGSAGAGGASAGGAGGASAGGAAGAGGASAGGVGGAGGASAAGAGGAGGASAGGAGGGN